MDDVRANSLGLYSAWRPDTRSDEQRVSDFLNNQCDHQGAHLGSDGTSFYCDKCGIVNLSLKYTPHSNLNLPVGFNNQDDDR